MAYNILKSNGASLGTIADGTYDDRVRTSLKLIGRNYSNYGQLMTDNLMYLLENFANNIQPPTPQVGQLWYNTGEKRLRVYSDTGFKSIPHTTANASAPTNPVAGDFWFDPSFDQLYVYDGRIPYNSAGWILVGPQRNNSGAVWEQITDDTANVRDVLSLFLNGFRTAIINSSGPFTPGNIIAGFGTIQTGFNQNAFGIINATVTNAGNLGGIAASNYLRSDIDDLTTGNLTIANNSGITIGLLSNLTITTTVGGAAVINNTRNNGDINFNVNVAGIPSTSLTIEGTTGDLIIEKTRITDTTQSINSSTGALIVSGGVGIAKNLNVVGESVFDAKITAPTAPAGTANTMVATTEFVVNNSGFLRNKIYDGGNATTSVTFVEVNDTGSGNIRMFVDGASVATASSAGFNLLNGATAVTQPDTYNGLGNARVATTQFVKNATQWWGGSKKFVSSSAPAPGVNDVGSEDGDFWFQYIP